MALQMKLADDSFFCFSCLGDGIRQELFMEQVQPEKQDGQRGRQESWETFEVIGPFSSNMQAHIYQLWKGKL